MKRRRRRRRKTDTEGKLGAGKKFEKKMEGRCSVVK